MHRPFEPILPRWLTRGRARAAGHRQPPRIKRVAVRLYVTLPGDARKEFEIDGVDSSRDSWFSPRELAVNVQLRNTGHVRLEPTVTVDGARANGSELLMSRATERYIVGRSVPFWGGPVRLRVDAQARSLGIAGPVRQLRVTVWVIPWHLLTGLLALAGLVFAGRKLLRGRGRRYRDIQTDIRRIERLVSQQAQSPRAPAPTDAVDDVVDADSAILSAIKQARGQGTKQRQRGSSKRSESGPRHARPAIRTTPDVRIIVAMPEGDDIVFRVRPEIDNEQLNRLHAEGFKHHVVDHDWRSQLRHSLLWIGAFDRERLVGFVNVAWDGGVHAFLLDTAVETPYRRRGMGTRLVREAIEAVRQHSGIEWLHVDSDEQLMERFYFPAGFAPTPAGLVNVAGR